MTFWTNHSSFGIEVEFLPGQWVFVPPGNQVGIHSSMGGNVNIAPPGTHTGAPSSPPPPSPTPTDNTWDMNWAEPMASGGPLSSTDPGGWASTPASAIAHLNNVIFSSKKEVDVKDVKDEEHFYNRRLSSVVNFKTGLVKGDIGLEIECEGTHLFTAPFAYWTCHADGSLRETAGHPPIEYVLKAPLSVPEVKEALQYLSAKLKESGSKLVKSNRTSVHVHVNCQKMTIRELYCFLCLYLIFEELLVDWSGPERAGNLFCLRAKDSGFYITMLESVLKNHTFKQWREDYRYAACNVASITKFGSLEFRSMQGTVNVEEIQTWVEILMMLKEASEEYDNPIEIVEDFTSIGPLPFFKKIFKHKEHREIFEEISGLSGKLWDGLRLMRDVAYGCEWKPYIKKKQSKKTSRMKIS